MLSDHLDHLEAESIHILREVAASFAHPVILYSVGKDSSVLVHLARKAFFPGKIPFPLVHIDTTYEYPELIEFRDWFVKAIAAGTNPYSLGTAKCCSLLRTRALVEGLQKLGADAAIGGARRDEERSRAKERVFSFRNQFGQWDPKDQRPELWNLYNPKVDPGESMRVFPLSNWTEFDVWKYIERENIPIVPLYFAKPREVYVRGNTLIPVKDNVQALPGEKSQIRLCRMRSLGCTPCSGAIESEADTVEKIIEELFSFRRSERENRVIDHDQDGSMELKKREGYF
jgi:sulfate adenylyltransferase subunit 2